MPDRHQIDQMVKVAALLALLLAAAPPARAQGSDFGAAPKKANDSGDGDLDSQAGLESATPTDNVNEINSGGSPAAPAGSGGGGVDDFPATNDATDFDLGNSGGAGGGSNGVFNNAPVNVGKGSPADQGAGSNVGSAFGGSGNPAANGANAAKGNGSATPPALNGTAAASKDPAANPPGNNASPANAPPTNAEALMKNVNTAPSNTLGTKDPAGANPAPPNATGNESKDAVGTEDLVKKPEAPPPIEAPPLPPPNDFAGAPPVPGTMRLMAEGEAPEEYRVEHGDTLYDICDQLLDEAAYWPKLWALNPEIKNPHFIFPNMRLRFYPGDDDNPPYLQVVNEDDIIPIDKGDLDEQELVAEKVNFFSEDHVDERVTEVIGPDQVDALQDEILTGGRFYTGGEVQVQVPGFIFASEKEAVGYVIGGRSGEISLQPGLKGIVESVNELAVGTLYTVLRPGDEVLDPDSGDRIGYKYYFIANMRMDKDVGEQVFIGTVQDSRLPVMPNDLVVSYISTKRSVPSSMAIGALSAVEANVVGFEYPQQELGGMGHYAFIDKGNTDGVSPGMYLPLYATPGYLSTAFGASALGSAELPVDYEFIGVMRIIDATEAGAVGYVIKNTKEVRVGDRTAKG